VCSRHFSCALHLLLTVFIQAVDEGSLLFDLSQALKKDSSSDSSISSYN
jgi:hypothetical protein